METRNYLLPHVYIIAMLILSGCGQTATAILPVQTELTSSGYPIATLPPTEALGAYPLATLASTVSQLTLPPPDGTPTLVATPAPTATPVVTCPGAPAILYSIGETLIVSITPPVPSRLRDQPSLAGKLIKQIGPGEYITITEGPICSDNYAWWRVETPSGFSGWTVEGDLQGYWLVSPGVATPGLAQIVLMHQAEEFDHWRSSVTALYDPSVWDTVSPELWGFKTAQWRALQHRHISECYLTPSFGHGLPENLTIEEPMQDIGNDVTKVTIVKERVTGHIHLVIYVVNDGLRTEGRAFEVVVDKVEASQVGLCIADAEAVLLRAKTHGP